MRCTLDALPDATLTIYPGLGPAIEILWLVLPNCWTLAPRDNFVSPINLTRMFLGGWEEAKVARENPRIHGENMQTPHRKAPGGN